MPMMHYSDRHMVRLLATETRRTDTTPYDLSESHRALGRFLAGELAEHHQLQPLEINHPQGKRSGWCLAMEERTVLMPFMRAGLYVAEGVRELFRRAPLLHVTPLRGTGLPEEQLGALAQLLPVTCVLIDAVVNTGASLEPVLAQLQERRLRVQVLSLVSPTPTAKRLAAAWPEVTFLFARLSDNQYTGKGTTDTGNRLFGTTREEE